MNYKVTTLQFLPKKFWKRISLLLVTPETKASPKETLEDNPEIRKTLVDLAFFPETLN